MVEYHFREKYESKRDILAVRVIELSRASQVTRACASTRWALKRFLHQHIVAQLRRKFFVKFTPDSVYLVVTSEFDSISFVRVIGLSSQTLFGRIYFSFCRDNK